MSDQKDNAKQPQFTPEQMAKMKENMLKNYTAQIEFLKVQVEFEELNMRVIEAQARSARAETILAQIYGPGPDQERKKEEGKPEAKSEAAPTTETIMVQPEEGAPKEPLTRKLKTE